MPSNPAAELLPVCPAGARANGLKMGGVNNALVQRLAKAETREAKNGKPGLPTLCPLLPRLATRQNLPNHDEGASAVLRTSNQKTAMVVLLTRRALRTQCFSSW